MWIIYGAWAWAIITTLVKWFGDGEVAAANHGIMAAATALFVTFLVLIVRWFTKPQATNAQEKTNKVTIQAVSNQSDNEVIPEEFLDDDALYEIAYDEVNEGTFRKGIMAKAIVEAEGDLSKQHAIYIKYRVQSLKDEIKISKQQEIQKKEEENKEAWRLQRIKDVDDYFGKN